MFDIYFLIFSDEFKMSYQKLDIFNKSSNLYINDELKVVCLKYLMVFQMHEGENIAGGMSYRTMNGIDTTKIMKYLEGSNKESYMKILEKNKDYYIASAKKTIARLKLAEKRVEHGDVDPGCAEMINVKILSSLKWLEKLKEDIKSVTNKSELLEVGQYKKWHAVKLLPSAAEGIIITSLIKRKINNFSVNYNESPHKKLENARIHNEKAEAIFLELLNLSEKSDFIVAERSRIEGYNEAVLADKQIQS